MMEQITELDVKLAVRQAVFQHGIAQEATGLVQQYANRYVETDILWEMRHVMIKLKMIIKVVGLIVDL